MTNHLHEYIAEGEQNYKKHHLSEAIWIEDYLKIQKRIFSKDYIAIVLDDMHARCKRML
ncbi:hypothetical protein AB4865_05705 [Capnocytophaga sp. ARDL2]|uniref:hypothetical protein n=1 Tax=Capnocytophaga sp. ARDL2 TaxID=3238809 RepID=UPI003556479E